MVHIYVCFKSCRSKNELFKRWPAANIWYIQWNIKLTSVRVRPNTIPRISYVCVLLQLRFYLLSQKWETRIRAIDSCTYHIHTHIHTQFIHTVLSIASCYLFNRLCSSLAGHLPNCSCGSVTRSRNTFPKNRRCCNLNAWKHVALCHHQLFLLFNILHIRVYGLYG